MTRVPFSQVLKNAKVDFRREYDRLYNIFYVKEFQNGTGNRISLKACCADNFLNFPFRGTCISLKDFDNCFSQHYEKTPVDFNLDYLVRFCEYSYNLAIYTQGMCTGIDIFGMDDPMQFYIQQVSKVIEIIGYMPNPQNGITDFVPKDQAAISVAEIIDSNLSYRVIEYNHHSIKGDLEHKREILLALGDKLEPQRAKLKSINSSFEDDLFYLFNNVNLRHNNRDPEGKKYHSFVATMEKEEIEQWYDDTYQMCLLAFLELDQTERKTRVINLKKTIQNQ